MRAIAFSTTGALLMTVLLCTSAASAQRASEVKAVLDTEHRRVEALLARDFTILQNLYHPDFVSTNRNGVFTHRAHFLAQLQRLRIVEAQV